jgi:hypothetical protein
VRGFDKVILGNTLLRNIEKDKQNKKIIGAPQRLTGVRENSDSFSRVDAWRLSAAPELPETIHVSPLDRWRLVFLVF